MDIKVQNKIIEIANAFRPNLNRPVFMENNRLEWIDLLKCAILKKEEEEKLLKKLLDSIELAKVGKALNGSTFTVGDFENGDIVPHHTKRGRKPTYTTDPQYNNNIVLCNNK